MTSQDDGETTGGTPQYEGHVDLVAEGVLIGWARRVDSDAPVSVSIYSRGRLVSAGSAALYRADLQAAGKGNGWHAFRVPLPPGVPLDGLRVDADQIYTLPLSQSLRSAIGDTAVVSTPIPVSAPATGPVVWLDLSDFLFYLRHHKTVSGIQRVQCEIVRALLAGSELNSRFCITSAEALEYYEMPGPVLASLLDHLDTNNAVPEAEWIAYVRMIADTDRLRPAHIVRGDMLFVLGAFWCLPESVYLIASLRSRGVHVGVYIYDLIPLNNPEYCDGSLVDIFVSSFALVAQITDLIFTISAFTAQEVAAYYKAIGLPAKTIKPIPLAHEMHPGGETAQQLAGDGANQRLEAIGGPYVLCVCTIEIRKNHVYLLRIWRELLKRYPRGQVPKLVLVGRRGWRVEDFFGQLQASRNLDGHVHVLHDLDNADLQVLYKNCLFTVFPTLCEGWGLPVGESLTYGKLCVASHATSVPEVGHEFCTYIDPDNVNDGYRTIERLIFNKDERTALETAIRTRFQPRSWNMVTAKFVAEIVDYWRKAPASLPPVVVAGRGELVQLQRKALILSTEAVARERPDHQLICTEGWHSPEAWGTWARGRSSRLDLLLELATPPPGSGRVRVYLLLRRPSGLPGTVLTVSAPCGAVRKLNIGTRTKYLTSLECTPLPAAAGFGGLSLTLLLDGEAAKQEDGRLLGIGISALVVVDADDVGQRLEALESLVTLD